MNITAEFKDRVFRTRFSGTCKFDKFAGPLLSSVRDLKVVVDLYKGAEIDAVIDGRGLDCYSRLVIVFETVEDCLAFTLKYGDKYA